MARATPGLVCLAKHRLTSGVADGEITGGHPNVIKENRKLLSEMQLAFLASL